MLECTGPFKTESDDQYTTEQSETSLGPYFEAAALYSHAWNVHEVAFEVQLVRGPVIGRHVDR